MGGATVLAMIGALFAAAEWQVYSYPQEGFAVDFPTQPSISLGPYRTIDGHAAPAVTYWARQDQVRYTVTVVDFSRIDLGDRDAAADAVKALVKDGTVKADAETRLNFRPGRALSIEGKDGRRTLAEIFFFDHRLYQLAAEGPSPGSGALVRFQQSLQFIHR
jgi:hypothetical protein